jgi:hypothetical protein
MSPLVSIDSTSFVVFCVEQSVNMSRLSFSVACLIAFTEVRGSTFVSISDHSSGDDISVKSDDSGFVEVRQTKKSGPTIGISARSVEMLKPLQRKILAELIDGHGERLYDEATLVALTKKVNTFAGEGHQVNCKVGADLIGFADFPAKHSAGGARPPPRLVCAILYAVHQDVMGPAAQESLKQEVEKTRDDLQDAKTLFYDAIKDQLESWKRSLLQENEKAKADPAHVISIHDATELARLRNVFSVALRDSINVYKGHDRYHTTDWKHLHHLNREVDLTREIRVAEQTTRKLLMDLQAKLTREYNDHEYATLRKEFEVFPTEKKLVVRKDRRCQYWYMYNDGVPQNLYDHIRGQDWDGEEIRCIESDPQRDTEDFSESSKPRSKITRAVVTIEGGGDAHAKCYDKKNKLRSEYLTEIAGLSRLIGPGEKVLWTSKQGKAFTYTESKLLNLCRVVEERRTEFQNLLRGKNAGQWVNGESKLAHEKNSIDNLISGLKVMGQLGAV